jgi:hypothetical protein
VWLMTTDGRNPIFCYQRSFYGNNYSNEIYVNRRIWPVFIEVSNDYFLANEICLLRLG